MNPHALEAVADRARRTFAETFAEAPAAAACAPGRVNLIGDHTDYNRGLVLPFAIDRWCVAAGALTVDPAESAVSSHDLARTAIMDLEAPADTGRGWWSVIRGVAALFLGRDAPGCGVRIALASSVPIGAGLASSAAVACAVGVLLQQLTGVRMHRARLADLCRRAEHEYTGVPCGPMDQLISLHAEPGRALLIDCRDLSIKPTPLPHPEQAALLLVDSGVRHELASSEYARRRRSCESAAARLGLPSLREATLGMLVRTDGLTEEEQRCARHVVTENHRVLEFAEALRSGDLPAAGACMTASHDSLRSDFRVSCPRVDALVRSLAEVPGVYGARMTGAGFGGCVVALATPDAVGAAARELPSQFTTRVGIDCACMPVRSVGGARPLGC